MNGLAHHSMPIQTGMKLTDIQDLGLTPQRKVVLSVIHESCEHLTASEVFASAKGKLPSISFATVYNSLRFLKDAGHIGEINFGNGASRFDRMTSRHDHAICTKCDKLVDIEMEHPPELADQAWKLLERPSSLHIPLVKGPFVSLLPSW